MSVRQSSMGILTALVLAASPFALAGDAEHSAPGSNALFDRLKTLEGTWVAPDAAGKPSAKVMSEFKVVAMGHSIRETVFPGTAEEMVNMYYLDGTNVQMVHYCAAGNQPRTVLRAGPDDSTVLFEYLDATGLDTPAEEHMHNGKLVWTGTDRLRTEWQSWKNGKPAPKPDVFEMMRQR